MGMVYSEPACQSAYDGDLHRLFHLLKQDHRNLNVQDAKTGDTPLIAACRSGNLKVIQYLLKNHADINIRNNCLKKIMLAHNKKRTCLHYTARRTFSFLDYLMIIILIPILLMGYFIMREKQRKNLTLMKTLLDAKVDIDAVDNKGNTGLHYVVQRKSQRLVPLMLEKNASTTIKNNNGETALDIAIKLGFKKIIVMLNKIN